MGTLILPPIHFNDQVYDSLKTPISGDGHAKNRSGGSGGSRRSGAASGQSSSAGSRRSPLDLPMSMSAVQTQRSMTAKRSTRQRRQQSVGHVTKLSGAQCEQNRKRFESALERADDATDGSLHYCSSSTPEPRSPASSSHQVAHRSGAFSFNTSGHQSSLPSITDTSSSDDRHYPYYLRAASCSIRSRTNGPTIVGSPLYNRQTKLFPPEEAVSHALPAPASGVLYNHERYRTRTPAAQQHIERVSSAFRAVVSPRSGQHTDHSTALPAAQSDAQLASVLLVPAAEADAADFSAENYFRDHPCLLSSTFIDDHDDRKPTALPHPVWLEDAKAEYSDKQDEATQEKNPELLQEPGELQDEELQNAGILQNIEEVPCHPNNDVLSPAGRVQVTTKDEPLPPHPTFPEKKSTTNNKPKCKTRPTKDEKRESSTPKPTSASKERQGSVASASDSSSELPSRPSSATYWKQRTWVDDATVTSEKDEVEDEIVPDEKPEPSSKTRPEVKSPEKNKPEATLKSALRKSAEASRPAAADVGTKGAEGRIEGQEKQQENAKEKAQPVEVMNLNDLKRKRVRLPDFICPSSEEKSRESAVMDWLTTTRSHWAMKTAPLL